MSQEDAIKIEKLRKALRDLGTRGHAYNDSDNWYSCPLAPGGCANENEPKGVCNCDAEAHNAKVEAILKETE